MIPPGKKEARYYVMTNGGEPFVEWLTALMDVQGRAIVKARVRRMEEGNPGQYRAVGQGVYELKIAFGPGYRVYFGLEEDVLVILLCGGDKGSQKRDIAKAHQYWADHGRRS